MNNCIQKAIQYFSLFLITTQAAAMDLPPVPQIDKCEEILPRVIDLLERHRIDSAIDFLRGNGNKLAKDYLKILEDKKKRKTIDNCCELERMYYKENSLKAFKIALDIEEIILLLQERSSLFSRSFGNEFMCLFNDDIQRLKNHKHKLEMRKTAKDINQHVISELYIQLLSNGKIDKYCHFNSVINEKFSCRIEETVYGIINELGKALHKHYFSDNCWLDNMNYLSIIEDAEKIKAEIIELSTIRGLEEDDFIKVGEIIKCIATMIEAAEEDIPTLRQIKTIIDPINHNPLVISTSSAEEYRLEIEWDEVPREERKSPDEKRDNSLHSPATIPEPVSRDFYKKSDLPMDQINSGEEYRPGRGWNESSKEKIKSTNEKRDSGLYNPVPIPEPVSRDFHTIPDSPLDQINKKTIANLEEADKRRPRKKSPKKNSFKSRFFRSKSSADSNSP